MLSTFANTVLTVHLLYDAAQCVETVLCVVEGFENEWMKNYLLFGV